MNKYIDDNYEKMIEILNGSSMSLLLAYEITNEIPTFISNSTYLNEFNSRCKSEYEGIRCRKINCTNGKHYGIKGIMPNRRAIVWFDNIKENI